MRKVVLAGLLLLAAYQAHAQTYSLVVQPILTPAQTSKAFAPLAAYLSQQTGITIRLQTALNFVTYWETMKKGEYDLVLDAAHFTDYRIKRQGYRVLARIPDTVSLTLVMDAATHGPRPSQSIECETINARRTTPSSSPRSAAR